MIHLGHNRSVKDIVAAKVSRPRAGHAWWAGGQPRAGVVERFLRALAAIGDAAGFGRFVEPALADGKRYDLHMALIPAVKALWGDLAADSCGWAAWRQLHDH